nr:xylulose kinase-1 [Tanacetum cinerariifolium]
MVRDDENATNPPSIPPTQQSPHTLSTIKLPILKKDRHGQIRVLPPKTAKKILAREREGKARTTLLMAILEDHLAKFYKITDAKEMWEAIKSRFGGNDESKKMQKYILKQQFKSFSVSNSEGSHKGSTTSSSSTLNVAFVSSDSTSSTNEVSTAYGVSTSSVYNSQREDSSSYTDELISKENQESRRRDAGNTRHKARDNGRRPTKQDEPKAMVTIDEDGVDWTEAKKEKEELKTKLENFQSSSKGLSKLLNSQMSAKDKSGLGYGTQIHEGVLNYKNEVLKSVFDSQSSDVEDSHVNDRFAKVEGMHAVPPPMTGIYMPPKFDFRIDESKFTYVPKPVESKPKAVSEPNVWSDAHIIKEYESDSDDEYVFKAKVE